MLNRIRMRSSYVLIVAAAVVPTLVSAGQGQPAAPAAAPPDFTKVEIKATRIRGNVYTLDGQGGRSESWPVPTAC